MVGHSLLQVLNFFHFQLELFRGVKSSKALTAQVNLITNHFGGWKVCVPRRLIFTALQWISRRPRSQNISKERTLNPEKDSTIKRPRLHLSSEKSSKNYKPLENWAKPNLLPDVTPEPANSFGECIWRVCHVVKPDPREFLAILTSQINWPRRGERAGWIAVWYSSLTGW